MSSQVFHAWAGGKLLMQLSRHMMHLAVWELNYNWNFHEFNLIVKFTLCRQLGLSVPLDTKKYFLFLLLQPWLSFVYMASPLNWSLSYSISYFWNKYLSAIITITIWKTFALYILKHVFFFGQCLSIVYYMKLEFHWLAWESLFVAILTCDIFLEPIDLRNWSLSLLHSLKSVLTSDRIKPAYAVRVRSI